jgi:DNA mismatch endonuclease (patch repair protein)
LTVRARDGRLIERVVDGHRIRFDAATSRRMGGIRQRDTAPELLVRRALAEHGLRFRIHNRDLPGAPDIANRARKWAVFVHGCYWHRHPGCKRTTTPKRNAAFWLAKFDANVARDARTYRALVEIGYEVLSIWECEAERPDWLEARIARFAARVCRQVRIDARR